MSQTNEVGVLAGFRVIELTMWVAGPSAGGIMADWGADVIKVEPAAGDPQRNSFRALGYRDDLPNPGFALDNRGKRSVVLDLNAEEGRAAMERLLESADVYLTNMRPRSLEGVGLAPEQVHERHPNLVVTTITGYGLDGEEAWRPGYDIGAFWARSGIARDLVPKDTAPLGVRGGMGDHTTGITAVSGTMAALLERTRTGNGRIVEASLLRTGVWAIGHNLAVQQTFGRIESAKPRERLSTPLVAPYRAGDDRWFWLIGVEADRHFPGLMKAIDRTDLIEDPRFVDAKSRRANSEAFIAELDDAFGAQPLSFWAERFDTFDVWWSPANSLAEALEDPQIAASGAFVEIEAAEGGEPVRSINTPITFRGNPLLRTPPPPEVGQHTAEVLAELGIDA
jgi:crotonobetainyl-CoA:carnitine CoA-transferase CaiB-like acyl-CoA transferase